MSLALMNGLKKLLVLQELWRRALQLRSMLRLRALPTACPECPKPRTMSLSFTLRRVARM